MVRSSNLQKWVDRYVGIPILFFHALLNRIFRGVPRLAPAKPQKVGILCVAALGDLLLLSAVLQRFRECQPQAWIILFCGPDNQVFARELKFVDEIHVLRSSQPLQALKTVRAFKFDLLIDSSQWARWPALLSLWIKSDWKVGFKTKGQGRHWGYDQVIGHKSDQHEMNNFAGLFESWGNLEQLKPQLKATSERPVKDKYVVCHMFPGGGQSHLKEWPSERWVEIFQWLKAQGYLVVITGSQADVEKLKRRISEKDLQGIINLVGKTSFKESIHWISHADLVLSVNTGLMHFAAAFGVPLVALHGPTDPARWGPLSRKSVIVESKLPCSPCLNLGFEYACPRNDCMRSLSLNRVIEAIEKVSKAN